MCTSNMIAQIEMNDEKFFDNAAYSVFPGSN